MISLILSISILFSTTSLPTQPPNGKLSAAIVERGSSGTLLNIHKKGFMEKHDTSFTVGAFVLAPLLGTLAGMQMWDWGDSTHFKANSDGWFARTQTHGGADKTGHMWTFYMGSKLFGAYFEQIYPEDRWKAALYGAALSSLGGFAVEIGDGFATNFGFSWPDLVFDFLGIALALAQARWPIIDNLIDLSVSNFPTYDFWSKYNENKTDFFTDYSGHIVTINIRMGGIPVIKETPLKYFRLDLGYFTRCYQPYDSCSEERTGTHKWETRNLYFGVSFDLAKMLDDHADGGRFNNILRSTSRLYNIFGTVPLGFNVDLNHGNKIGFGANVPTP